VAHSEIKSFWKARSRQFEDCRISEFVQPRERPFWNAEGFESNRLVS
jgi:hypothetical protein